MIGAHPQPERDEVGGLDSTVRAREDERRRALGHVDGKRVRPGRRRKSPCSVLDDGIAQHDLAVATAPQIAESLDHIGRRPEPLELEGTGVHAEAMSNTCVDEAKDARHRPLRTAAQTQRFEKLGERPLVLGPSLDRDDVGLRVA